MLLQIDAAIRRREEKHESEKRKVHGMIKVTKPWIKLLEYLDDEEYGVISALADVCMGYDGTALKLELDYKLAMAKAMERACGLKDVNELMYFDGEKLIGYIGIGCFGGPGSMPEINGMVHPDYRGQGVFTALHHRMLAELRHRGIKRALLLCDGSKQAGKRFVQALGAKHEHSEYEMYVKHDGEKKAVPLIALRKATNSDAMEIARQNAIYFGNERNAPEEGDETAPPEDIIMPEEEEKRGMTMYLAYAGGDIVGKVHAQVSGSVGGIYGLGVLPEYRGRGLGRAVLLGGVEKLREMGAKEIMLQVVIENANALHLYESCGFETTSTMEYYELKI